MKKVESAKVSCQHNCIHDKTEDSDTLKVSEK